jgi:hypothetical protein
VEAGRDAHDVSGQDDVEDLALAVAQQLVTDGVAVLYERKLAILLAVDNEVAPPRDRHFALDDGVQATQVVMSQIDLLQQPGQRTGVAPRR